MIHKLASERRVTLARTAIHGESTHETVLMAAALLIGAAAVSAQAPTTDSTPNSTQTRTGAGVDPEGTSGMGSGPTTDSRATRVYPADVATTNPMATQSSTNKNR